MQITSQLIKFDGISKSKFMSLVTCLHSLQKIYFSQTQLNKKKAEQNKIKQQQRNMKNVIKSRMCFSKPNKIEELLEINNRDGHPQT